MSMHLDDTIVAIATPPGRGGIGIVRLAGPDARAIVAPMLRLKRELARGQTSFGVLVDSGTGDDLDEVVVSFFQKPRSYTGDDIVEICAHGAPVVLQQIVEASIAGGARPAEPGEFTMRAFLNGRLDLAQAEAVRDLINSQTLYQAKVAAQQLGGSLSQRLAPVKQGLVKLVAAMEAGIDFAEDDVSVLSAAEIVSRLEEVRRPLLKLEESFAYGKVVNEGLTLAIIGRPNVGKSSVFNRLVERERAIVTAFPGTTRDLISETVSVDGLPIRLLDTAGLRQATDEAESLGIRKSYEALAEADMVLMVVDASSPLHSGNGSLHEEEAREESELLKNLEGRNVILVENKSDLAGNGNSSAPDSISANRWPRLERIRTSALTGDGIKELRAAILNRVRGEGQQESGFLTNVRHQALVRESLAGLESAEKAANNRVPHEMIMLDIYSALRPLDAITGETTADDVLDLIFSSFCIGK